MQLELISHVLCPFVHRAGIMLREKGVDYSRRDIDLEDKPAWFLALSPRGKVPVLVADGTPLFESAAIVEFLDETHPPQLVPADPFARARQRAWVEVATELFIAQYRAIMAKTAEEFEAASTSVSTLLGRFDEALTSGQLARDGFGLVEVATAPALYRFALVSERTGYTFWPAGSAVEAWAQGLARRPSVTSSVSPEFPALFMQWLTDRGSYVVRPR